MRISNSIPTNSCIQLLHINYKRKSNITFYCVTITKKYLLVTFYFFLGTRYPISPVYLSKFNKMKTTHHNNNLCRD